MELRTFIWCVKRYTKVGDTILDPMSGTGTIHFANFMGRSTVGIELVPRFAEMQERNWQNLHRLWEEDKFYDLQTDEEWDHKYDPEIISTMDIPSHSILQGDCRRHLPLRTNVQAVIFSPPYGNLWKFSEAQRTSKVALEKKYVVGYDDSDANVGNYDNYTAYTNAMRLVYAKCLESVQSGGIMVTIVKDYVKGGRRVNCSRDNWRVALEAGWQHHEWHLRDASMTSSPFQVKAKADRIAKGKHTRELEVTTEDIIVLRKP